MIRAFKIEIEDSLRDAEKDIDELERKWGAEEIETGHWIEHPETEYLMFYECSECGDKQYFCKSDIHRKHFCNNCGAKMEVSDGTEI